MRMDDVRGNPYTVGCAVIYRDENGQFKVGQVKQVIEITGELVIDTFPVPVKADPGRFIIILPKRPRTLFLEALEGLLDNPHDDKLEALGWFVSQANEALEGTPLWVRRDTACRIIQPMDFTQHPPDYEKVVDIDIFNRCAVVPRCQTSRVGSVAVGVGVALDEDGFILFDELDRLDIDRTPEDIRNPAYIKKLVMEWVDQLLERQP